MIPLVSIRGKALLALIALFGGGIATAQNQLGRIEVGKPFPDERFPALKDGRPGSVSDFRGKRVLLLVFASW